MPNGKPFTYNPRSAAQKVTMFERWVRLHEIKGAMHPDLHEWIEECYAIARERMVRTLTGDSRPTRYMPRQPRVEYDR